MHVAERMPQLRERYDAISPERRIRHLAVATLTRETRRDRFEWAPVRVSRGSRGGTTG